MKKHHHMRTECVLYTLHKLRVILFKYNTFFFLTQFSVLKNSNAQPVSYNCHKFNLVKIIRVYLQFFTIIIVGIFINSYYPALSSR